MPPSYKAPCDYTEATWIIQDNLPHLKILIISAKYTLLCKVTYSDIHKFQRLGYGHLWVIIIQTTTFFFFFGLCPQHMEGPRLGVESELHLPDYATAPEMEDRSHVFDLHHTSWQHQILSPLSEARDRTQNLMDPSRVR